MRDYIVVGVFLFTAAGNSLAANEFVIEEIIVSAQRVEENAQRVPIALSAFDDALIEDRQIIGILDIQLNAPNVSATDSNFGNRVMTIRGVGNLIEVQGRAQTSVSYHVNQVPFGDPPLTEFYDLERLEVLRGPQGTLYGRNSTAGTVNTTTKRPSFGGLRGHADLQMGNYDLVRTKAAAEMTFSDRFALRLAGYKLDRDGYIDNLADGQVPNVDGDLDGRDIYSFRITPEWRISDRTTLWLMYEKTHEDDDRVRVHNQICKTNPLPTTACIPGEPGQEAINPSALGLGPWAGIWGLFPFGASDAATGLQFDHPRPELGIRDQHTDLEPTFELDNDVLIAGFEHDFDQMQLSILVSYREAEYLSTQDWYMDVSHTLNPSPLNPSGMWPTSSIPTGPKDPFGGPCPIQEGIAGVWGGCVIDTNQTRAFAYDVIASATENWSAEAKLASSFSGTINFLVGVQYLEGEGDGIFVTGNNLIDGFMVYGWPGVLPFPSLYPSLDFFATRSKSESYSAFGELYWTPTERLTISGGLRYTESKNRGNVVPGLGQSLRLPGDNANPPEWIRQAFAPWVFTGQPDETGLALAQYHGVADAALAATGNDLLTILRSVPPIPTFGEFEAVFGTRNSLTTDSVTGRLGLDWQVRDDVLLYAFYSRGHSPGGFTLSVLGQAGDRFDDEKVNAFEIGTKSKLLGGSLLINVAAFYNQLDDIHVSGRPGGALPVEVFNMDADAWGIEIESRWRPSANLDVEFVYGWFDSSIDDFPTLDIIDLTQGNADLVLLRDTAGPNFVAPRAGALAVTPLATQVGAAFPAPGTVYPDGIPAWFSRGFLEAVGVPTSDGVLADLDGNQLPVTPKHSIRLGVAYTWYWQVGSLTARWDYYWQSKSYARVFNHAGDKIDPWHQHNASLTFASASNRWLVKAWVRNISDDDNVTDHYLHSAEAAGPYRNYFLTEPRVYGLTLSYSFGEQ